MLMDKLSQFSSAQAVTSTALSTSAYDLLAGAAVPSAGSYTTPNSIIGNASTFGMDLGIGSIAAQPRCVIEAIAAFTTGGTTLQIQFQGVPDPGTGTLSGASWVTFEQSDTLGVSLLTANTLIASFDWPIRKSLIAGQTAAKLPRFVVLNYVVASGPFSTGSLTADNTIGGADDALGTLQQYPANFTVAA